MRVFISYSHDSPEHKDRVWALSERLRTDGIDCRIDQHEFSPPEGWPRWCRNQVQESQFVLVVCTETYKRRYEGKVPAGAGKGAKWEGFIITLELYEAEANNTKFIPVVFCAEDVQHIPLELSGATRHDLSAPEGYDNLFRQLTDQPARVISPVARRVKSLAPLARRLESPPRVAQESASTCDVFLSHSHEDAKWVEDLAKRLTEEHAIKVWLDKWNLTPGGSWQQEMARGLDETRTCAVCVGSKTPVGWFRQEIERALDLQTRRHGFRVIPVLLPGASVEAVPQFLSLRTWADFRSGQDDGYALHVLVQGIRGEPIGRWPSVVAQGRTDTLGQYERKLKGLQRFKSLGLHEEVVVEFERRILTEWFEKQK